MNIEEVLFFDRAPDMLPIYAALRDALTARYGDVSIRVGKTQISFRNRHIFAMASLPLRRLLGAPKRYLLVSFGLSHRLDEPRVLQAVEPYPGRWTHHAALAQPGDVDDALLAWLDEAYRFSMAK